MKNTKVKMSSKLESLSKEDLIKVVANMHDVIQSWNSGWGLENEECYKLIVIGKECTKYCVQNNNWEIPKL